MPFPGELGAVYVSVVPSLAGSSASFAAGAQAHADAYLKSFSDRTSQELPRVLKEAMDRAMGGSGGAFHGLGEGIAQGIGQSIAASLPHALSSAFSNVSGGSIAQLLLGKFAPEMAKVAENFGLFGQQHSKAYREAFERHFSEAGGVASTATKEFEKIGTASKNAALTAAELWALSGKAREHAGAVKEAAESMRAFGVTQRAVFTENVAHWTNVIAATKALGGKMGEAVRQWSPEANAAMDLVGDGMAKAMSSKMKLGLVGIGLMAADVLVKDVKNVVHLVEHEFDAFAQVGKHGAETLVEGFTSIVEGKMPNMMRAFDVLEEGFQKVINLPFDVLRTEIDNTIGHIPILGRIFKVPLDMAQGAMNAIFPFFDEFKNLGGQVMNTMMQIGNEYQEMTRIIAGSTVDTGAIEKYAGAVRDIMASGAVVHFEDVAENIGRLSANISGLDMSHLKELTTTLAEADELVGHIDATKFAGILNAWDLDGKQANETLTMLVNTARQTGIEFNMMTDEMTRVGPAMRELGYDAAQSATFFAKMTQEGERGTRLIFGMNEIVTKMSALVERGVFRSVQEGWEGLVAGVQKLAAQGSAAADSMAISLLKQYTTPSTASLLYEDLKNHILDASSAMKVLQGTDQDLGEAVEKTKSLGQAFEVLGQQVRAGLAPIGVGLAEALVGMSDKVGNWLKENQGKLVHWGAEFAQTFLGIMGQATSTMMSIVSAAGPLFEAFAKAISGYAIYITDVLRPVFSALSHLPGLGPTMGSVADALQKMRTVAGEGFDIPIAKALSEANSKVQEFVSNTIPQLQSGLGQIDSNFQKTDEITKAFTENFGGKLTEAFQVVTDAAGKPGLQLLGTPEQWDEVINKLKAQGIRLKRDIAGDIIDIQFDSPEAKARLDKWWDENVTNSTNKKPANVKMQAQNKSGTNIDSTSDLLETGTAKLNLEVQSSGPSAPIIQIGPPAALSVTQPAPAPAPPAHAAGGYIDSYGFVHGSGPGNVDSVGPVKLPIGSYVIRKPMVDQYGAFLRSQPVSRANGGYMDAMLAPGEMVMPPGGPTGLWAAINSGAAGFQDGGETGGLPFFQHASAQTAEQPYRRDVVKELLLGVFKGAAKGIGLNLDWLGKPKEMAGTTGAPYTMTVTVPAGSPAAGAPPTGYAPYAPSTAGQTGPGHVGMPADAGNMATYIRSQGKAAGLTPTEIGMVLAVMQHEGKGPTGNYSMGFGPEAKAQGYNFDEDPLSAVDQFLRQYTSRFGRRPNLDRNDANQVAEYIWHVVHGAADPNYVAGLFSVYPGPVAFGAGGLAGFANGGGADDLLAVTGLGDINKPAPGPSSTMLGLLGSAKPSAAASLLYNVLYPDPTNLPKPRQPKDWYSMVAPQGAAKDVGGSGFVSPHLWGPGAYMAPGPPQRLGPLTDKLGRLKYNVDLSLQGEALLDRPGTHINRPPGMSDADYAALTRAPGMFDPRMTLDPSRTRIYDEHDPMNVARMAWNAGATATEMMLDPARYFGGHEHGELDKPGAAHPTLSSWQEWLNPTGLFKWVHIPRFNKGGHGDDCGCPMCKGGAVGFNVGGLAVPLNTEGAQADTIAVAEAIAQTYNLPGSMMQMYYPADDLREHSSGEAVDVMVGLDNMTLGNAVRDYALANHDYYGVEYAIWQQTLWYPNGTNEKMGDRGSPRQNHRDHVHIRTAGGGFPKGQQPGPDWAKGVPGTGWTSQTPATGAVYLDSAGLPAGTPVGGAPGGAGGAPGVTTSTATPGELVPRQYPTPNIPIGPQGPQGAYTPFIPGHTPLGVTPYNYQQWTAAYIERDKEIGKLSSDIQTQTQQIADITRQRDLWHNYWETLNTKYQQEYAQDPRLALLDTETQNKMKNAASKESEFNKQLAGLSGQITDENAQMEALRAKGMPLPTTDEKYLTVSQQLGAGLVKGIFQELGFPDVFGKAVTSWGLWKLAMGGLGYGIDLWQQFKGAQEAPHYGTRAPAGPVSTAPSAANIAGVNAAQALGQPPVQFAAPPLTGGSFGQGTPGELGPIPIDQFEAYKKAHGGQPPPLPNVAGKDFDGWVLDNTDPAKAKNYVPHERTPGSAPGPQTPPTPPPAPPATGPGAPWGPPNAQGQRPFEQLPPITTAPNIFSGPAFKSSETPSPHGKNPIERMTASDGSLFWQDTVTGEAVGPDDIYDRPIRQPDGTMSPAIPRPAPPAPPPPPTPTTPTPHGPQSAAPSGYYEPSGGDVINAQTVSAYSPGQGAGIGGDTGVFGSIASFLPWSWLHPAAAAMGQSPSTLAAHMTTRRPDEKFAGLQAHDPRANITIHNTGYVDDRNQLKAINTGLQNATRGQSIAHPMSYRLT
jgi:hypothetical protein